MNPIYQAVVFIETTTAANLTWRELPKLDERVELRWFMPTKLAGM